ncbi:MAG: hypothetical protein ACFFHD_01010 [Promethearchaeota archaeon]
MGKSPDKLLLKADKLNKALQYKRAAKVYGSAGDSYLSLDNYRLARDCFYNAAICANNEEKYKISLKFLRNAGNASLIAFDFSDAYQIFRKSLEYVSSLSNASDRNHNYILFSSLSYLCLFLEGKQEEGLNIVKKYRSNVDNTYFKDHPLVHCITNLTFAIKEKSDKYLKRIERDFDTLKLKEGEIILAKNVLVLAESNISLINRLSFDKDIYTTNDTINLILEVDTNPLKEISNNKFYSFTIEELEISKISITLSDNLTSQKNSELPILLKPGKIHKTDLFIKPHFQMENSYVGPILLSCKLNGNLIFYHEISQVLKPNLISPLPSLDISLDTLRTPLIDTTFPLEVLIENKSEGEALDLKVNIEFPEQIKVMRGTLEKQIYSLRTNENIKWEINVKPIEAGDYIIKVNTKFNDPDQNIIEDNKEFPLSIKL